MSEVTRGESITLTALGFTEASFGDPEGFRLVSLTPPGSVAFGPDTDGPFTSTADDDWTYRLIIPNDLAAGRYQPQWQFNGVWYADDEEIRVEPSARGELILLALGFGGYGDPEGFRLIDPRNASVVFGPDTDGPFINTAPGDWAYQFSVPDDLVAGEYQPQWEFNSVWYADDETLTVSSFGPGFATADDVAARLGRDLTVAEGTAVEFLLAGATGLIADSAGRDDTWASELDPVPAVLTFLVVELVCRALANPSSIDSSSESLGQWSYSARFRAAGLMLTPVEEALVDRAVYGTQSGSSRAPSVIDDVLDMQDDGEINDSWLTSSS